MLGARREREVRSLFETHYVALCRLAFVMLRDAHAAEETVMDAFVRALAGWKRIRTMDRPDLYLRTAVVNGCTSRLRRGSVERKARGVAHVDHVPPPADPATDLWDAVRALPARQRAAVVLHYVEDRPTEDIANILGCTVGTVKSQLAKARRRLKETLEVPAER
jgi:RNA polymerase sigma-70 factor (sigma-E family)